jgi:putative multiple sugar transport system ATP-binding protein
MHGKPVDVSTIQKAIENGIAYVTEDRKNYGLVLIDDIKHNVTLANLPGVQERGDRRRPGAGGRQPVSQELNIRCSSVFQQTVNLSGGNQQKVVLSKWLFTGPEVLILDEPTRGIDVGAKYEIYTIINQPRGRARASSSSRPRCRSCSAFRPHLCDERRPFVGEMPAKEASRRKRSCAQS